MRNRLLLVVSAAAILAFSLLFGRQLIHSRDLDRSAFTERHVRVLTYGTLVANQGPAPEIFRAFEAEHQVKLDVVVSSDVGLILERLKVGGAFDLVIGIDHGLLAQARSQMPWRALTYDKSKWHPTPANASDEHFVAIDWSPLTFVYRKDDQPIPRSFAELNDPRFKDQFTVEDPRVTTPGLQFARWVKTLAGDQSAAWLKVFKPNVHAVTPTWTAAYGLFERKETRFVWTYLTSLAFHWGTQNDSGYAPLIFPEGHPAQVEFAAIPANCANCELGEQLLAALLTPAAQATIMKKNFMLPVLRGPEVGTVYADLPTLKLINLPAAKDLAEWNDVFGR